MRDRYKAVERALSLTLPRALRDIGERQMKHPDSVMKELWAVKDANATKHRSAAGYLASLRKSEQREHLARLK